MSVVSVGFNSPSIPAPVDLHGFAEVKQKQNNAAAYQPKEKPQGIQATAADIQKISSTFNKKLQFVVDQMSKEVIVKVIDKDTDKVIRELPPEELQRLHRSLKEAIGQLFNELI